MTEILSHSRVTAAGREPDRWLLVLHGIYGTGRNWGSIARRVADARPEWGALLVDLRQHGGSRGFAPPHSLEATAADVAALVEHLGIRGAGVLGHSFGGKVALVYTREHPAGLRQAWVIDSTLEVREPSGTAWRMIEVVRPLPDAFGSRQEAVTALEAAGYSTGVAQWMAMNLAPAEEGGGYRWRLDFDEMEEMLRDYFRTDVWDVLERPPGDVEVHLVRATRSDAIDDDAAQRVRAAPRAFLHEVAGGHWLNADNPDAVVDLLATHLP